MEPDEQHESSWVMQVAGRGPAPSAEQIAGILQPYFGQPTRLLGAVVWAVASEDLLVYGQCEACDEGPEAQKDGEHGATG